MAQTQSRGMWIWRGAVSVLFVGLLVWGPLSRAVEEFLLIALGGGTFIMAVDLFRIAATLPRSNHN